MNPQEKVYALIGRFQIQHSAHVQLYRKAIDNSDHAIIIVGSANRSRDPKNPFTFEERKGVIAEITNSIVEEYALLGIQKKVSIIPSNDSYNWDKWLSAIYNQVDALTTSKNITLTGSLKDASSEYINVFRHWKKDLIPVVGDLSATTYRDSYFGDYNPEDFKDLPVPTQEFLKNFYMQDTYFKLKAEWEFIPKYRVPFRTMPYAVPFVTGDSLVTCAGKILVIVRGRIPGKGTYALPGGFFQTGMVFNAELDSFEVKQYVDIDPIDSGLRELQEEGGIAVTRDELRKRIVKTNVYADAGRSLRWRIITHTSHIQLLDDVPPAVYADDDAAEALWIPIQQLKGLQDQFFEDHYLMIEDMLDL